MASPVQELASRPQAASVEAFYRAALREELGVKEVDVAACEGLLSTIRASWKLGRETAWALWSARQDFASSRAALDRPEATFSLTYNIWKRLPEELILGVFDRLLEHLPLWDRHTWRIHKLGMLSRYFRNWAKHHPDARVISCTKDPRLAFDPETQYLRGELAESLLSFNSVALLGDLPHLRWLALRWAGWSVPSMTFGLPATPIPCLQSTSLIALSLCVTNDNGFDDWLYRSLCGCPSLKDLWLYQSVRPARRQRLPPGYEPPPFSLKLFVCRGDFDHHIERALMVWAMSGSAPGTLKVAGSGLKWPVGSIACRGQLPPLDAKAAQSIGEISLATLNTGFSAHPWLWPSLPNLRRLQTFMLNAPEQAAFERFLDEMPQLETIAVGVISRGKAYSPPASWPTWTLDSVVGALSRTTRTSDPDNPNVGISIKRLEVDEEKRVCTAAAKAALEAAVAQSRIELVWKPIGSSLDPLLLRGMWELDRFFDDG